MTSGLPAANIALIGFMASGKTSVGRLLSHKTGLPYQDVDGLIEAHEGMTIAEIFASRGEKYFRELETTIFRRLCAATEQIIGLGGGTLIDPENSVILRSRCYAVWLRVSAREVARRIKSPGAPVRPLIPRDGPLEAVSKLLCSREPLYSGADLVVYTDGRTIDEIAEEIRIELALPLKENGCG